MNDTWAAYGTDPVLPLGNAVVHGDRELVVLLLSSGADPNGDCVMAAATKWGTPDALQLVVDAGGKDSCAAAGCGT